MTARPTFTFTPRPTPTSTPQPLGSQANPIIMAFVSSETSLQVTNAADQISKFLSDKISSVVQVRVYDSYPALLAAIETGKVHITWMPPFTYILAHQKGLVDAVLMSNHFGIYSYGMMILANIESGFTPFFDPNTNQNTADTAPALKQFDGKRPCWVDPKSASGYVVPLGIFTSEDISLQEPVITQSFNAVIRSLYVQQICDFGATYAISGDPRTASSIQDAFPDIMQKVVIIWRSDAIIPNVSLVYKTGFPRGLQQLLTDALVNWVHTSEGKTALTNVNQYDVQDLKAIDDTYFDPLRTYLLASAIAVDTLIGR